MELQLQNSSALMHLCPRQRRCYFQFSILPHPEKVHFSTTVFGIFALFLFDFYFSPLFLCFWFPFASAAHVQQIFTCHSFFSMYIHACIHAGGRLCVFVCVCVRNCIRLVLKVALYMHILCAWPKPIGCLLQFCAAYFFSTPPPTLDTQPPPCKVGLQLKPHFWGPRAQEIDSPAHLDFGFSCCSSLLAKIFGSYNFQSANDDVKTFWSNWMCR